MRPFFFHILIVQFKVSQRYLKLIATKALRHKGKIINYSLNEN